MRGKVEKQRNRFKSMMNNGTKADKLYILRSLKNNTHQIGWDLSRKDRFQLRYLIAPLAR